MWPGLVADPDADSGPAGKPSHLSGESCLKWMKLRYEPGPMAGQDSSESPVRSPGTFLSAHGVAFWPSPLRAGRTVNSQGRAVKPYKAHSREP